MKRAMRITSHTGESQVLGIGEFLVAIKKQIINT